MWENNVNLMSFFYSCVLHYFYGISCGFNVLKMLYIVPYILKWVFDHIWHTVEDINMADRHMAEHIWQEESLSFPSFDDFFFDRYMASVLKWQEKCLDKGPPYIRHHCFKKHI